METLDEGWSRRYQDPRTNESWLEAFISIGHSGVTILRKDPPPENVAEWIEKSFSSNRQEDAVGLALELSGKHETWNEVVEYLEANKGQFAFDKVDTFIKQLTILNPVNRRPVMNKHYTEVEKDYEFFRDLSERARRLLNLA